MPHERTAAGMFALSLYYKDKDVTTAGTSFLAVKDVQERVLYL